MTHGDAPSSLGAPMASALPAAGVPARLLIDPHAIARNWQRCWQAVAPGEAAAVVKANGYGLGLGVVVPALWEAGARAFFVATAAEGVAMTDHLPRGTLIHVLNGPAGLAPEHLAAGLRPVLNQPADVAWWRAHGAPGGTWLHLDSGMARLGFQPEEDLDLQGSDLSGLGVMTHFANADDPASATTAQQVKQTLDRTAALERASGQPLRRISLANSAGCFHRDVPRTHGPARLTARPGCALYGVNPTPGLPSPVEPVIRLEADILQVREVKAGQAVGYGASFVADRPMRLATLAIGYADGYLRCLGNQAVVGFHLPDGSRVPAPVVGRVSMDLTIVDVTRIPESLAHPGASATILDDVYTVNDAAADAGTIGYEILTRLGSRFARRVQPNLYGAP